MTRRVGRSGKGYNRARMVSGGGTAGAACGSDEESCEVAGGHICCAKESGGCGDPFCGLDAIASAPGGGAQPSMPAGKRHIARRPKTRKRMARRRR